MIKSDEFKDYKFFSEGGRASYYHALYLLIQPYSQIGEWPLVSAVGRCQNHLCRWDLAAKDEDDFVVVLNHFSADRNNPTKIKALIEEISEAVVQKLESLNLADLKSEELNELIQYYYTQFSILGRLAAYLRHIDRGLRWEIENKYRNEVNSSDYLQYAPVDVQISYASQEELAVLELAVQIDQKKTKLDSNDFEKTLRKIWENYHWLGLGYYSEPIKTVNDYRQAVLAAAETKPAERILEIGSIFNQTKKQREKIIGKCGARLRILADIAAQLSTLKDLYKFRMNRMILSASFVFDEIAARKKVSKELVRDLLPEEMGAFISGEPLDKKLVAERVKQSIVIGKIPEMSILIGDETLFFYALYFKQSNKLTVLSGRVASHGHGRGRVRVVFGHEDFSKFRTGEILVVANTSPDFIPIMKQATAIVAEDGGITSHVSINSRELNIPCVVGVNDATTLLKDGDLVEVDADRGVVRILEKNKS